MAKNIDTILSSFDPAGPAREPSELAGGKPIAVWLPPDYKNRYDRLQAAHGRRFSKHLRELIKAAIEHAESRAV